MLVFVLFCAGIRSLHSSFFIKRACPCTYPDWRSCSLIQPACQRVSVVYSEALCQRWWSSEDTQACSPEWRDPGSTDSSGKRSNHSQSGGVPAPPHTRLMHVLASAHCSNYMRKIINVIFYVLAVKLEQMCSFVTLIKSKQPTLNNMASNFQMQEQKKQSRANDAHEHLGKKRNIDST